MTPPDEHTSEGGRDDETIGGVPYHAESTLSSAQVLIAMKNYCSAVHEVRPDLEETGQPREDQIRFTLS